MNDSIDINSSLKIIKGISPYLLKIREKASNEYKESNNDFVHKADMLCLSFMQKNRIKQEPVLLRFVIRKFDG